MKITHLTLKQFRCFEHLELDLVHPLTVLVGKNASGKTAILDSLASLLRAWASALGGPPPPFLRVEDVRSVPGEDATSFEEQGFYPAEVAAVFDTAGGLRRASFVVREGGSGGGSGDYVDEALRLRLAAQESAERSLPVLLAFGADRAVAPQGTADLRPEARVTRWTAYDDVRSSLMERGRMRDWIAQQTFVELQDGQPVPQLRAVAASVHACLEGASGFRYSVKRGALEIRLDGRTQPLDRLSDGQRALVLLVADIARRAAQLNPHLGEHAARDSEGVVLLDEVELHLHPAWQRQVLPSLRRAFPKLQFIVTTHSPQVVASAEAGQVLLVSASGTQRVVEPLRYVEGRDSNSLLLDVFGELERPVEWQHRLDELHELIGRGSFDAARAMLREVEDHFGPDDPEVVRARWSIDVETPRDKAEDAA